MLESQEGGVFAGMALAGSGPVLWLGMALCHTLRPFPLYGCMAAVQHVGGGQMGGWLCMQGGLLRTR